MNFITPTLLDERLAEDYKSIELYKSQYSSIFDFEISGDRGNRPPDKYILIFKVKSIVNINKNQEPVYGYEHRIQVSMSNDYPRQPFYIHFLTDFWHPNVECHVKEYKGRVCANSSENLSSEKPFNVICDFLKKMVTYEHYWAKNDRPFPEDQIVASWVNNIAEPRGYIFNGIPIAEISNEKQKELINLFKIKKILAGGPEIIDDSGNDSGDDVPEYTL